MPTEDHLNSIDAEADALLMTNSRKGSDPSDAGYQQTEVAEDYSAGFQAVVASLASGPCSSAGNSDATGDGGSELGSAIGEHELATSAEAGGITTFDDTFAMDLF